MFDVITFGSATSDTFLKLKKEGVRILEDQKFKTGKELCFSFGSKIFIDDAQFFSGGGGTNTACAFASQGFNAAYAGAIGDDIAGRMVYSDLKKFKVSTYFLKKDRKRKTALSFILSPSANDRTILLYEGACHFLERKDLPWLKNVVGRKKSSAKPKWFYLAPFYGKLMGLFEPIVDFARANQIRIAANLSVEQINLSDKFLKPILSRLDVLILNEEEASLLTKISKGDWLSAIKKMISFCPGIAVITKGKNGSMVSDGRHIFSADSLTTNVMDKTGAGDAFGAGFVAGLLQENDIKYAIQLGTANSASCIREIGAKNGLLKKNELNWPRIKVKKINPRPISGY